MPSSSGSHLPGLSRPQSSGSATALLAAALIVLLGALGTATMIQTMLSSQQLSVPLISPATWTAWARHSELPIRSTGSMQTIDLPLMPLLLISVAGHTTAWLLAGFLTGPRRFGKRLTESALKAWIWWLLPGVWELLQVLATTLNATWLTATLLATQPFWLATACAGWLAVVWNLVRDAHFAPRDMPVNAARYWTWAAMALYAVVLTSLNWLLWNNLLVPHGDSAMYEEHLWNLLHGKGFRSYLDQGLFLGEHIQVAHLLLIPFYVLWPSHLLLELSETLILAASAWPVYRLTLRHAQSQRAAMLLAVAWLLYFPLQYLDIAIDLKTFRPINFGLLFLLLMIDQLELRRWKTATVLGLLTLSAKEDYAVLLSLLGFWLATCGPRCMPPTTDARARPRTIRIYGASLALFGLAYLWCSTRIVIPWFRDGAEVHYARYFQKFGNSLTEIAWNLVTRPDLLFNELATPANLVYLLALVMPLGFTPWLSLTRFAVAAPMIVLLCLNELSVFPHHHFHAPVLPILIWAAAAGIGRLSTGSIRPDSASPAESEATTGVPRRTTAARFALMCALTTTAMFGMSPLAGSFWDPGSNYYWRKLYVTQARAIQFQHIADLIPRSARVASTDFVHPRYTHHERSYDYSEYPRKVSDYKLRVPDDTDYIVIDTRHPYSIYRSLDDIREYREAPDNWEVLPDTTDGYFIVLKRR